ncbi:MAG TPA: chemotaxis protein CheW [Mycobacteriales bacterium]|nr:chemotaxis protein CheW [Mycobacteriales bacterium]
MRADSPDVDSEVVVVRLGGTRYGLAMAHVAEVGRPPVLTRVPGLPEWVAGVANWRGRVLGVLDVRTLLGGARSPLDRRGRMVVLTSPRSRTTTVQVGLLVEDVEGSALVDAEQVEPPLASLPDRTAALLAGQVTDADGPCGLLELSALFGLADELPRARRAG